MRSSRFPTARLNHRPSSIKTNADFEAFLQPDNLASRISMLDMWYGTRYEWCRAVWTDEMEGWINQANPSEAERTYHAARQMVRGRRLNYKEFKQ